MSLSKPTANEFIACGHSFPLSTTPIVYCENNASWNTRKVGNVNENYSVGWLTYMVGDLISNKNIYSIEPIVNQFPINISTDTLQRTNRRRAIKIYIQWLYPFRLCFVTFLWLRYWSSKELVKKCSEAVFLKVDPLGVYKGVAGAIEVSWKREIRTK